MKGNVVSVHIQDGEIFIRNPSLVELNEFQKQTIGIQR